MKVLLSYVPEDSAFAVTLTEALRGAHVQVVDPHETAEPGANIVELVTTLVNQIDRAIVVLSRHYAATSYAQQELATLRLSEIAQNRLLIIPIRLDDSEIPSAVNDRVVIDARPDNQALVIGVVLAGIWPKRGKRAGAAPTPPPPVVAPSNDRNIEPLRQAFRAGRLTLVCGAGISMEAGLPGWDTLLNRLLLKLFERNDSPLSAELADAYQRQFAASPIILARHL